MALAVDNLGESMNLFDLVRLTQLMGRTDGSAEIMIGLIDGPVALNHPDLAVERIHALPGKSTGACTRSDNVACQHGTFVAGILSAKRTSKAPAICPGCTLLVRPIFSEATQANGGLPNAKPEELAEAILDCIHAGARLLNISAAIAQPSTKSEKAITQALEEALRRGVIVAAAAGNQGTLGGTAITSHPWVIPVAACNSNGKPLDYSNLGSSIGRRGLCAPGDPIASLGSGGKLYTGGGTSAATPFVTGALALLWSEFPEASAAELKLAALPQRRASVVPPLLDAWGAYRTLLTMPERRRIS
jgi:subtilisin family serine protease